MLTEIVPPTSTIEGSIVTPAEIKLRHIKKPIAIKNIFFNILSHSQNQQPLLFLRKE